MRLSKSGKKELNEFGQWWIKSNGKDFHNMAEELISKGFTEQYAIDFLKRVYSIVSSEYGNFHDMAEELIDNGFTKNEAIDFLKRAYSVVSSEYGN